MKFFYSNQVFCFCVIIVLFLVSIAPSFLSDPIDQPSQQSVNFLEGQILYSPMYSTKSYLIDSVGNVDTIWNSIYLPGVSVWWLGDGKILRSIRLSGAPGGGGGVQILSRNGTVLWDFRYNTDKVLSHHDVKSLPNGNVLLIAWERKTKAEAIEAGRNPSIVPDEGLSIDHLIEVKPTGPTTGQIVWEWHAWDHLIQDFDPTKNNYGVVSEHPELIDINYIPSNQWDIMHTNSVDYNEHLDQIMISVCYYNEIWVIDHSTSIPEAAGHVGGNSGRGGDILYRWGNPKAYGRGSSDDQRLFHQHDSTWIKPEHTGGGNILIFNNGIHGQSSIDEIKPPVVDYYNYSLETNTSFGPSEKTWCYAPTGFYAGQFGGATRLENGNTLISNGETGRIFEVDQNKDTIWQYNTNAVLFKAVYVPPEDEFISNLKVSGSLSWFDVEPESTVHAILELENIGDAGSKLNWSIDSSAVSWGTWSIAPISGTNLTPEDGSVTITISVVAPEKSNTIYEGYLRVENEDDPTDYELISATLKTPEKSWFPYFNNIFFNYIKLITEKIWLLIK